MWTLNILWIACPPRTFNSRWIQVREGGLDCIAKQWKGRTGDLETFRTQFLKSTHCCVVLLTSNSQTRKHGSKCLVHCKMGVSRSASTVIAYAMKEYGWNLDRAYDYVKERRTVTKPNPSFMRQLEEYQGILLARWVFKWLSQLFPRARWNVLLCC